MSDSESGDSDRGIRYKTETVRNRNMNEQLRMSFKSETRDKHKRSYSPSPRRERDRFSSKSSKKRKKKKRSSSTSSSDSSDRKTKQDHNIDNRSTNRVESARRVQRVHDTSPSSLDRNEKDLKMDIEDDIAGKQISIGPALPPHMVDKKQTNSHQCSESDMIGNGKQKKEDTYYGPALPPATTNSHSVKNNSDSIVGPKLPYLVSDNTNDIEVEDVKKPSIGPELPPNLRKKNTISTDNEVTQIGPIIPPEMMKSCKSDEAEDGKIFGPIIPAHLRQKLDNKTEEACNVQDEEDEDTYGPLPVGMTSNSESQQALEERALQMKIDQFQPKNSDEPVRESWMTELPAVTAANLGLGARQFRNRSGPDLSDRSSWTDLPGDKNKKKTETAPVNLKAEAELRELKKRDEEQEMLIKKHKRKEKSLLKMHTDKLKKEKNDEGPSERRPFSRDIDLQVNRFDEAQKKAILKKAQLLDDRFSSGKSKFL